MAASVNVMKYVLHQYENFNSTPSIFFCFSSYTNTQTAESIAAKKQNLLKNKNQNVPIMLTYMTSKR